MSEPWLDDPPIALGMNICNVQVKACHEVVRIREPVEQGFSGSPVLFSTPDVSLKPNKDGSSRWPTTIFLGVAFASWAEPRRAGYYIKAQYLKDFIASLRPDPNAGTCPNGGKCP